jgi:beta-glucanase (GH16 family)
MRALAWSIASLALALAATAAAQQAPSVPKQSDRPRPIDGDEPGFSSVARRSLDGWDGDRTHWRVEDGALVGEITPETVIKSNNSGPAASEERVLFFDDFSGPSLDRTHWNVVTSGPVYNNEQQAYVDSPETVAFVAGSAEGASNGALAIQARYSPGVKTTEGKTYDFVSARLNTEGKFEFSHGTAAARMKLTEGPGLWPAFWILGTKAWPAPGEIDAMEYVGVPDWMSAAVHGPGYSGDTPLVKRAPFPAGTRPSDWHVYSVDWTDREMVFAVDGQEIYRVTRAMVERYGRWAFDNQKYLILNLALGGGYPKAVNGAERPYPGLPAPTVDLIKAGRARVLVDWVRVTAR